MSSKGSSGRGLARASDGAAIHYTIRGSQGPFVMLLHGWSCNQDFWGSQLDNLSDEPRTVAIDLPGHGRSTPTSRRRWSMEAFGADAKAVADALDADRLALIGHSMGGAAALEAALQLGPRCALVLGVDTFTDASFYRRRARDDVRARLRVFADNFPAAMETMVRQITSEGAEREVVNWIVGSMAGTEPQVALPVLEALLAWDIEARWPLLRCPAETINSAALAENSEQITLPGLVVHSMDAVGHFPMLEAPERCDALLLTALARHGFS